MEKGTLHIVATPIGNLEDITVRAIRVLQEVTIIYAEDTRVTKKLLERYDITTPVQRLDAHTEARNSSAVIEHLSTGESVAYVSDAGTPTISDPGYRLVHEVREAGYEVAAIPGASSITAALSIAGVPADAFTFLGFLPHKKGRQTKLQSLSEIPHTIVLLESTHRIMKLLDELQELHLDRTVVLARELTKMHEEVLQGTPAELQTILNTEPVRQKGEFVVVVEPLA